MSTKTIHEDIHLSKRLAR
jgi:hypothetical protein